MQNSYALLNPMQNSYAPLNRMQNSYAQPAHTPPPRFGTAPRQMESERSLK